VFDIKSGHGKSEVCLIAVSGRSCWHTTILTPLAGDDTFGTPQVLIPSANHVDVLQSTCCDVNPVSTLLYTSTNGGKSFSAPVRIGQLGVNESALVSGNLVFTAQQNNKGAQVESISPGASGPPASIATVASRTAYDTGLGQYKGRRGLRLRLPGLHVHDLCVLCPQGLQFQCWLVLPP
jgi:hypothetical protein